MVQCTELELGRRAEPLTCIAHEYIHESMLFTLKSMEPLQTQNWTLFRRIISAHHRGIHVLWRNQVNPLILILFYFLSRKFDFWLMYVCMYVCLFLVQKNYLFQETGKRTLFFFFYNHGMYKDYFLKVIETILIILFRDNKTTKEIKSFPIINLIYIWYVKLITRGV